MPAKTHGCSRDARYKKLYRAWVHMRERCLNINHPQYPNYGGRGIAICKRWNSFSNFLSDMQEGARPNLSLDRIDNDKGYSPSNCRWATKKEQNNNKRNLPRAAYKVGPLKAEIHRLRAQGLSTRAIAAALGLGKTTVHKEVAHG